MSAKLRQSRSSIQQSFWSPRKRGRSGPVINLRSLNRFLTLQHFKMEGMHVVRDLHQQGDWITRLDLKDAYFAILVHQEHRRYLRFKWQAVSHI